MGRSYPFKIGTNWAIPQLQTIGRTAGFAPAICPGRRTGGLPECVKSVSARCIKLRWLTEKRRMGRCFRMARAKDHRAELREQPRQHHKRWRPCEHRA